MIEDIQVVQAGLEGKFLAAQPEVDAAAAALHAQAPRLARDYLTDYSSKTGASEAGRAEAPAAVASTCVGIVGSRPGKCPDR